MKDNHILILSGMSGVGKDTIAQMLKDYSNYNFVISHTTRPMRDGESEGNPYYFVTKEDFDKIEFIEQRKYQTLVDNIPDIWYYGVAKTAIEEDKKYVVVLDVQGTEDFIEYFGERAVPIYLHVDDEIRRQRSINRGGHNESEWSRRLEDDAIVFADDVIDRIYYASFETLEKQSSYNHIDAWLKEVFYYE